MAMVEGFLVTLTFVTALGCGLIAGLFFAFSVAVMQALARLPAAGGMAAMQSINSAMLNSLFLAVFLATAAGCVLVMITALARWHAPGSVYVFLGGTLYLVGSLVVTPCATCQRTTRWPRSHLLTPTARVCGLGTLPVGRPGITCGRSRRLRRWRRSSSDSVVGRTKSAFSQLCALKRNSFSVSGGKGLAARFLERRSHEGTGGTMVVHSALLLSGRRSWRRLL